MSLLPPALQRIFRQMPFAIVFGGGGGGGGGSTAPDGPSVTKTSAPTVNLQTGGSPVIHMEADAGTAEVTEIDFSLGVISLGGNCINLTRADGTVDSFWFDSDEADINPGEGDNQYEINIVGSEGPSEWAAAAAAVIDSHGSWVANAVSGVLTITATASYAGPVVADGDPHATSLDLNITTAGVDPSTTITEFTLNDGEFRFVYFDAGITISTGTEPGGDDIVTEDGDWAIIAALSDGAYIANYQRAGAAGVSIGEVVPVDSDAPGAPGMMAEDDEYLYFYCASTGKWRRIAAEIF